MDNESEGAYVRVVMENLPNGYLLERQTAGPKRGEVFGPYSTLVYGIHSAEDSA